jgi:hypothetical protein
VRLANCLAYIGFVRPRAGLFNVGRTEPDLDQIKQVEQLTRFGRIPRIGITGAVGVPRVLGISQLSFAVNLAAKNSDNSGRGRGPPACEGRSRNATGRARRWHEPGHMGCRAVAMPNSVRLIHNRGGGLACCPDFKVSYYLRRSRVVAGLRSRSPQLESRIDSGRLRQRLVLRIIQISQLTPPPRFPGEGRDPLLPWAPAFAGEARCFMAH